MFSKLNNGYSLVPLGFQEGGNVLKAKPGYTDNIPGHENLCWDL